jgi:malate dehydrogenase
MVQTRGAAVIAARKLSSAMSAAKAIGDHLRDWLRGNMSDKWVSMGVYSTGNGYPSIPDDLYFSLPVTCTNGQISVVGGLQLSSQTEAGIEKTVKELMEEKGEALSFLQTTTQQKVTSSLLISRSRSIILSKDCIQALIASE